MRIYSWNVNGIRAVINKGVFIQFLTSHRPDVLLLQETKAQPDQIDTDFHGYHAYWNSAERKGYSGVGLLSRIEPIKVIYDLPPAIAAKYNLIDNADRDSLGEGRLIAAEYQKLYVIGVYTPNAKDDLSRIPLRANAWDPAFLEYMKTLGKHKPVVFGGDLNVAHQPIDLARPKENEGKKGYTAEERQGFQALIDSGFIDTFRLFNKQDGNYTWWTHWANARARNIGWRIDYCLASETLRNDIIAAGIHPEVMGSDHCPVSVEIRD